MGESKEKAKPSFTPIITPPAEILLQTQASRPIQGQQIFATVVSTLSSFGLGCALAWPSPAIPDLEKTKDFGQLDLEETSWITSLTVLGALVSGPAAGILIHSFGRRNTMLLMGIPFTLSWLCIGLAQNVTMVHVGRFFSGLTGGTFTVTIPVFVSEFAENHLRGMLGSVMVLTLVSGILFTYVVGAFVSWWQLALISAIPPFLCCIGLFFVPESPRYLLNKGKWDKAANALRWFRGAESLMEINPELSMMKLSIDSDHKKPSSLKISTWKYVLKPSILKPLAVTMMLMIFQQLSGVNAVQSYTVKIFQTASPQINPHLATIIIGIVQVFFVFLSMMLVDRLGRKFLLILSFGIMATSLGILGTFFFMKENTTQELAWIPLAAVICFVIAYSFGVGPLPWVLFGEIMSPNAKGLASGMVTSVYWIMAFISTKTFEELATILGWHGYYWHLAIISVLGGFFTLFFIPETKGKSHEEIQEYFSKRKSLPAADKSEDEEGCVPLNPTLTRIDIDNNFKSKTDISSEYLS